MNLDQARSMYIHHLEAVGRASATVTRYGTSFKAFQRFIPGNIKFQQVKRRDIEQFRDNRLDSCTINGVAIDLRHLRAFFNWCVGMDYIRRSPMLGVKIETENKTVRMLSDDELSALFTVIEGDKDAKDLVTFYLSSGARATEILPPRFIWSNVKQDEITLHGKRNKIRKISLNNQMKEILESRKHLKHPFPFSYGGVYGKIVRKYFRLAGIEEASLHNLRKTSGGLLIKAGVDIYRVSKFLGHSFVGVTEKHYVDLVPQDYQKLAEILGDRLDSDTHIIRTKEPITTYSSVFIRAYEDENRPAIVDIMEVE